MTKGIAVVLDKAVYEVYIRCRVLNPEYIVGIEVLQIARTVVLNKSIDNLLLCGVSYGCRLLQPEYNLLDSSRVHTANLPNILEDVAL